MKQHHFDGIIYYAWQIAAMEIQLKAAGKTEENLEKVLEVHMSSQDIKEALEQNKSIRQETSHAGNELIKQYTLSLLKAQDYRLNVEKDLLRAQSVLRSYLNNYADDRVRSQILKLVDQSKQSVTGVGFDNDPFLIGRRHTYKVFTEQLALELNKTFKHTYIYKEPPKNHFIIDFLSYPWIRGVNTLSILGGLSALTVGILASIGIITGMPATTVSALIAGGAIFCVTGTSLLIGSFFRHHSPEELAEKSKKITVPNISAQLPLPNANKAANDECTDALYFARSQSAVF